MTPPRAKDRPPPLDDTLEIHRPQDTPQVVSGRLEIHRLTATQQAAFFLARGVGAVIIVVIFGILWLVLWPIQPPLTDPVNNYAWAVIENYKMVHSIRWDTASRFFDLVVVKALLPVFTTLVGYIMGHKVAEAAAHLEAEARSSETNPTPAPPAPL